MSSNPKLFLIKNIDIEDITNFEIVKTTNQSFEESSNSHNSSQDKKEEHNQIEQCSKTPSSSLSEEDEEKLKKKDDDEDEDEEEDGFRTPTSLDHKISVFTCPPPPPKKIKQTLKRRAYNNQYCTSCRQLPLDLSKEVELLFPTQLIQLTHHLHKAKKIRRSDDKEQK